MRRCVYVNLRISCSMFLTLTWCAMCCCLDDLMDHLMLVSGWWVSRHLLDKLAVFFSHLVSPHGLYLEVNRFWTSVLLLEGAWPQQDVEKNKTVKTTITRASGFLIIWNVLLGGSWRMLGFIASAEVFRCSILPPGAYTGLLQKSPCGNTCLPVDWMINEYKYFNNDFNAFFFSN